MNGICEKDKNYLQHCIKKIGQVSAKPNVTVVFARSPNLLIWLLEQKYKSKCKRFGLWIIRKVIAYLQPYFFYTKRWQKCWMDLKNSANILFQIAYRDADGT